MDEYKNLVNQKTSALSSLGNANRQALKYADNTALAQGYATQGARLQNVGNLQNAYLNQVGGVNQQFQQQLGNLENTASTNALTDYVNELSVIASDNTLTQEQVQQRLNNLQNLQYGKLSQQDLERARYETSKLLDAYNTASENQQFIDTYGVNTSEQEGYTVEELLNADGAARKIIGQGSGGKKYLDGLQEILENNELKNGDTIKVKNNYYVYRDGKIYQTNNKIENPTYIAPKLDNNSNQTSSSNTPQQIEIDNFKEQRASLTNRDNIGKVYVDKSTGQKWKLTTSYGSLVWTAV